MLYGGVLAREFVVKEVNEPKSLGEDFKLIRKSMNLTQQQAAEFLECSIGHIQKIETGKQELKLSMYVKYIDILSKHQATTQGLIFDDTNTIKSVSERVSRVIASLFKG